MRICQTKISDTRKEKSKTQILDCNYIAMPNNKLYPYLALAKT